MGAKARVTLLRLDAEISILPRFANAIVSLRHRLFRKTSQSEQGVVAQHCPVVATERVDDRPPAPAGEKESLGCAEIIQTQSQLMTTMLESMILASGGNVDRSIRRNGSKPKR